MKIALYFILFLLYAHQHSQGGGHQIGAYWR